MLVRAVMAIAMSVRPNAPLGLKAEYLPWTHPQAFRQTLSLPPRTRTLRDVFEFLPGLLPESGGMVRISSSLPIQGMAMSANEATGVILPFALVTVQAGGNGF